MTRRILFVLLGLLYVSGCFRDFDNVFDEQADSTTPQLGEGLVAYYPFNGDANDKSGNGNDGTVFGAITTADRFGNENAAYEFDGTNDYIQATASTLPTLRELYLFGFMLKLLVIRPGLLGYGGGPRATTWFMGLNVSGRQSFHMSSHFDANAIDYNYSGPPIDALVSLGNDN